MNIDKRIYLKPKRIAYYLKRGEYAFNFCSIFNIVLFIERWLENTKSGIYNISDKTNFSAKQIINLEKKAGRAKVVIKIPYSLAKLGIVIISVIRKLLKKDKKDSFFNLYNFRKLFISRIWDSSKAAELIGDRIVDLKDTIYK